MYLDTEIARFSAERLDREIVKTQAAIETWDTLASKAAARGASDAYYTYKDKCDQAEAYLARLGNAHV